jgi:mRNA interferase RelE/StbE
MSEPAHWQIVITREAKRDLRRLPRDLLQRLDLKIQSLTSNPRPDGCRKLEGYENLYRVRVGDWRIIYAVEDDPLSIFILEIAPRGGAYQGL